MLHQRRIGRAVPQRQVAGREEFRSPARRCTWSGRCPTQPGTLRAVGQKGGRTWPPTRSARPARPCGSCLKPDRRQHRGRRRRPLVRRGPRGRQGRPGLPASPTTWSVQARGPATIAGRRQRRPDQPRAVQGRRHKVFHGLGLVVVKATQTPGKITLRAESEGLEAADATIESEK